ncbi:MAG: hypothetical protein ACM3XN_08645 [Chloroflexota bacterium]
MRIGTSQVALISRHEASVRESRQETLRYWIGNGRQTELRTGTPAAVQPERRAIAADRLELSAEMRRMLAQAESQARASVASPAEVPHGQAMDGAPADSDGPAPEKSAEIIIAEGVIEMLTGEKVEIEVAHVGGRPEADAATNAAAAAERAPARRAGWGLEYRCDAVRDERETTTFAATGRVATEDGRAIDFALATEMKREYHAEEHVVARAGDAPVKDPLVLNFGGQAGALTTERVQFDLDADGEKEAMPFAGPGSGFLVYDRDSDGFVDDGSELFGPQTGDGFAELAALDADGNHWIDEADPAYSQLMVWTRDGGSDALATLRQLQVGAIYLGTTETPYSVRDANNRVLGEMRESSVFLYEDGRAGVVTRIDVIAQTQQPSRRLETAPLIL